MLRFIVIRVIVSVCVKSFYASLTFALVLSRTGVLFEFILKFFNKVCTEELTKLKV